MATAIDTKKVTKKKQRTYLILQNITRYVSYNRLLFISNKQHFNTQQDKIQMINKRLGICALSCCVLGCSLSASPECVEEGILRCNEDLLEICKFDKVSNSYQFQNTSGQCIACEEEGETVCLKDENHDSQWLKFICQKSYKDNELRYLPDGVYNNEECTDNQISSCTMACTKIGKTILSIKCINGASLIDECDENEVCSCNQQACICRAKGCAEYENSNQYCEDLYKDEFPDTAKSFRCEKIESNPLYNHCRLITCADEPDLCHHESKHCAKQSCNPLSIALYPDECCVPNTCVNDPSICNNKKEKCDTESRMCILKSPKERCYDEENHIHYCVSSDGLCTDVFCKNDGLEQTNCTNDEFLSLDEDGHCVFKEITICTWDESNKKTCKKCQESLEENCKCESDDNCETTSKDTIASGEFYICNNLFKDNEELRDITTFISIIEMLKVGTAGEDLKCEAVFAQFTINDTLKSICNESQFCDDYKHTYQCYTSFFVTLLLSTIELYDKDDKDYSYFKIQMKDDGSEDNELEFKIRKNQIAHLENITISDINRLIDFFLNCDVPNISSNH